MRDIIQTFIGAIVLAMVLVIGYYTYFPFCLWLASFSINPEFRAVPVPVQFLMGAVLSIALFAVLIGLLEICEAIGGYVLQMFYEKKKGNL